MFVWLTTSFTRRASHRQHGQTVVDFGLSVAAVAFVAMIGFKALSSAQAAYWGALAPTMAAPTPGPGVFLHPTQIALTDVTPGSCSQGTQWQTGQTVSCVATVTDVFSSDRVPPRGSLRWTFNGTATTCTLNVVSSIASACSFSHTWAAAEVGSNTLVADYVAPYITDNHTPSTSPTLTFTVIAPYAFNFACNNPWFAGFPWTVEVGEPLFCTLKVVDSSTGLPTASADGLDVLVSAQTGPGSPGVANFACYTNDNPEDSAQHAAAHTRMSAPDCKPSQGVQPFACKVIPGTGGLCANNYDGTPEPRYAAKCPGFVATQPNPTCSFVYRREYDDSHNYPGQDQLTALAPSVNQSGVSNVISVVAATSKHSTISVVQCTPNTAPPGLLAFRAPVTSDTTIKGNGPVLSVSCATSVVDAGLNTAFDYNWCVLPIDEHCDIDMEQAHAPLGNMTLTVKDGSGSVLNTYSCSLSHLTPASSYVSTLHPLGAWFHASWCSQTLSLPQNSASLEVDYGGSAEHQANTLVIPVQVS